jgi:hypothetical protein
VWNICNTQINTLATYVRKHRWNIRNRPLQHTCTTIATYATSRSNFTTSIWNNCNILQKHVKHLEHTLATYVFRPSSSVHRRAERGTIEFGQPATEDGGAVWRHPAAHAACLAWVRPAPAPSPGCLAWAWRRTGHGMARRGKEAPWGMAAARRSGASRCNCEAATTAVSGGISIATCSEESREMGESTEGSRSAACGARPLHRVGNAASGRTDAHSWALPN